MVETRHNDTTCSGRLYPLSIMPSSVQFLLEYQFSLAVSEDRSQDILGTTGYFHTNALQVLLFFWRYSDLSDRRTLELL